MSESKEGYKQAVRDFRERHKDQLEITLGVLMEIRDDKEAGPKNRSDAAYRIARMLGALQSDKMEVQKGETLEFDDFELTDEEQAEMEKLLG